MRLGSWLASNCCRRTSLYFLTICRLLHFKHWALRGVDSGTVNHPRTTRGILIHRALWLLGIPSLNENYLDVTFGNSSGGMKIPSIGLIPQLCMFGPSCPCWLVMASTNPICQNVDAMGSVRISSLMSARMSTILPSDVHWST